MKIKILIPIYNDWQSISKLLDEINLNILNLDYEVSVVIVNDASNHDRQDEEKNLENIRSIKILNIFNISESKIDFSSIKHNEILKEGNQINKLDILFKKIEK